MLHGYVPLYQLLSTKFQWHSCKKCVITIAPKHKAVFPTTAILLCDGVHSKTFTRFFKYQSKVSNPIAGLDRPWSFQKFGSPRFQDSRLMKVVRLSALCTCRLYPLGDTPGTHFF